VAIVLDKAACSPAKAADVAELVDVLLAPLALSRRGPKRARVGVVELGPLKPYPYPDSYPYPYPNP